MKDKVTGQAGQADRRQGRSHHPVVGRTLGRSSRGGEVPKSDDQQQLLAGLAQGADQRKQAVREMLATFAQQRATESAKQRQQRIATISRIQGEAAEARAAAQDDLAGARQSWQSPAPLAAPTAPPAMSPAPTPARRRYYQPAKVASGPQTAQSPALPGAEASLPQQVTETSDAERKLALAGSPVESKPADRPFPTPPPRDPVIPPPSVTVEQVTALESSLEQMKEALKKPVPADPRVAEIENRLAVLEDGLTRVIDRLTEEAEPHPKISQLEGRFDSVESQLATIESQLAQTAVALERIVTLRQEPVESDPRIGSVEGSVAELSGRLNSLEEAVANVQQRLEAPHPESDELVSFAQRLNEIESSFQGVLSTVAGLKQGPLPGPYRVHPSPASSVPVSELEIHPAGSPDRQSAARVLASLSKLVEGLRQNASRPAEGVSAHE